MVETPRAVTQDLKGQGFSKIGHFKEVWTKIKELENLKIKLAQRHNRLEAILNSMTDGVTILDQHLTIMFVNRVQQKMFPDINLVGDRYLQQFSRSSEGDYEIIALYQTITATISLFRQHAEDSQIRIVFKKQFARGFNRILGRELNPCIPAKFWPLMTNSLFN